MEKNLKKIKLKILLFALILYSAFLTSCSVFQVYNLKEFPPESRTVYLQNFTNETFDPDVNTELNRILRETIHMRGNFILTPDRKAARFVLSGRLFMYRREGRMYDNYRNPARYMIAAGVIVRLTEGDRDLLNEELTSTADYSVSEGYAETEHAARTRLLSQLSAKISRAAEKSFMAEIQQ